MDIYVLAPAGIPLVSTLLILVPSKRMAQRRQAVHIVSESAEIHVVRKEGQTILGVMDTTKAMGFHSGHEREEGRDYA